MSMRKILILLLTVIQLSACNKTTRSTQKEVKTVEIPEFSSDSAYVFTQKQVDFGPGFQILRLMMTVQPICRQN